MKHFAFVISLLALPAIAQSNQDLGTLNPDEMSWTSVIEQAKRGETSRTLCASGYMLTKSGDHTSARTIFEACAAAGYTGAMTWMSQLDNNGLGGDYDPDASAEWDRQAAALGDPVGKFNYGIGLLRGYGVEKNEELGRQYVDDAARAGLQIAKRLQGADYDLDEVTPDADNWKYAPLF
ncbi:hypothetical protein BCF46_1034 [Litoreibacter meonggei]|uniref:Sel1 repeat-containing protein n=1 Tax=Litoreibacter meonggei TaxID=1049199 RepID=A0A497X190_9RHOB|nr:sel1 repeat family protein [Litoreibacter meonggei]RLJ58896.1 hypothetical protein BCF46_1034 [Litoreibacter meonggei]